MDYCVTRKELLVVVMLSMLLRTDNAAVSWMRSLKTATDQVARWLQTLGTQTDRQTDRQTDSLLKSHFCTYNCIYT